MIDVQAVSYGADAPLEGFMARGVGEGPRPGVLVLHEGTGLGDHAINATRRLAASGWTAFAADMYGVKGLSLQDAAALCAELKADPARLLRRLHAGMRVLADDLRVDPTRLATLGFCFGGSAALTLARDGADLRAAVCLHGELGPLAPTLAPAIRPHLLVCVGSDDAFVSAADRQAFEGEMSAARAAWTLQVYGGVKHSFTNVAADGWDMSAFAYDEAASADAWAAVERLFASTLTPHRQGVP